MGATRSSETSVSTRSTRIKIPENGTLQEYSSVFIYTLFSLRANFDTVSNYTAASMVLGSEFLFTDPEVRVRFPALPDFMRSSGSGTGSTQPREYNWGATWTKNSGSGLENRDYGRRDSPLWPHGTLYPQKLEISSLISGGCSVGIVRSQTQATEFSFVLVL
jgi:hypothetical protein